MNILDKIKSDVGLRNLTIYAQWAGVFSGLACGLTTLSDLVLRTDTMVRFFHGAVPASYIVWTVLRIFDLLILAPGVLILESPSLCCSIGWVFRPYAALLGISIPVKLVWIVLPLPVGRLVPIVFGLVVGCAYPAVFAFGHIFRSLSESTSNIFRLPVRFSLYLLVCVSMLTSYPALLRLGLYGAIRFIAPTLAAAAAGVLYGLAWRLEHKLVHSKLLGGSGIEPMSDMLFGLESESDPAGPGQIRL